MHHNQASSDKESFTCDICDAKFDTVSELEEHRKAHLRHVRARTESEQDFPAGDIGAAGLPTSPTP